MILVGKFSGPYYIKINDIVVEIPDVEREVWYCAMENQEEIYFDAHNSNKIEIGIRKQFPNHFKTNTF